MKQTHPFDVHEAVPMSPVGPAVLMLMLVLMLMRMLMLTLVLVLMLEIHKVAGRWRQCNVHRGHGGGVAFIAAAHQMLEDWRLRRQRWRFAREVLRSVDQVVEKRPLPTLQRHR